MSNQKPPPSVVQQTRYPTQSTYLPRPPTPRTDAAFHVTTQQPYVQPPPNQAGNQGPGIRAMAPTGPPTQASTPPNSDLKVSQMSQSMNLAFVQPVRGTTPSFFGRPPPQSQPPRMPNHRIQGQQAVFPPQSTPFIQQMPSVQPLYCMSYYGSSGQRPMVPQYYPGQTFTAIQYPQTPQQTQTYINYQQFVPRGHQPQVVPSAPQNIQQVPPPQMALAQTTQQQQQQGQKKRRAKAISIIDPETGRDKLDEIYTSDGNPPSGESSARQTPQPHYIPNKEVQNTFNKQVNMVINQEKMDEVEHSSSPSLDQHIDTQPVYLPPTQAVHISNRNDLVQSSKLQLTTKEFVPAGQHINTAKEVTPTPVVSANVVTAEVTINKQSRESPVKTRKPRELQLTKETKEPPALLEKKEDHKTNKEEFKIKEPTSPPVVASIALTTKEVKEANNQREEKKAQKKDKVDQQKPLTPTPETVPENISLQNSVQSLVPAQENGKSKQRSKDVQKQQAQTPPQMVPTNNKQNTPIPVPQSQPAKPNNKSSKMRELNMKGANKEGTDMDAFSDNTLPTIDTVVVTNTNTTINDMINANDIINNVNDSNKKIESNDISTIKSENKILPKKIDVTDIVKDIPKPFVAPVEPCDETDRVEYDNDKIVQVKNEVNTKVNAETDSNVELKPNLPYKEDQWSPSNTSGKKVYDKDFLLALRNDPKSRKKPDNLLDMIAQEDRGRIGDINRYPMGGKPTDFTPNFSGSNYSAKSMSTRGTLPNKRNSQQGKNSGNAKGGGKSANVIRSLSVRGDVKLNESENAWKPARFVSSANMSDDEKKTQELYKKVRGVLNKLTPQKFETLLIQVRGLTIDTKERLQGVIDLVFEKAVDEPNFSVAYANMCKELALMQVPASSKKEDVVNFRKLLVTRCQLEFEKNSIDETVRNGKLKEIEECTDPEKKKELQLLLEEDDRRIRRKSVGNIRFIGELFKQQMLTVNIMLRCLNHLVENRDEESLECLCKLLSTVGKEVEERKVDLHPIFTVIREIVDKKHGKVSSRVRFMLQDVIDLRNSKWVPRRQDINPKTIDQIQKEANDEQLTIQAMNAVPLAPRKEERTTPGPGAGKRGTRNASDSDGWSTASSRSRAQFSVQSDKLKNKPPQIDEPLGSSHMFGTWIRGSGINQPTAPVSGNMFAALENIGNDSDKRNPINYSSKDPYHSKGTSLERPNYKHSFEDGRGSRSGSQHRSRDNLQRSKPMPTTQQNIPKNNPPSAPKPRQAPIETISVEQSDQLQRKIKNILEEYLNDCYTVEECDEDIRSSLPPSALPQLVSDSYILVLERSKTARIGSGTLFAHLIKRATLSIDNYCIGLEEVLGQADDLTIDIPKIWDYLAEIIAPIIYENAVSLVRLQKSFDMIIKQGHASKLLDPLFKLVIAEKGPNYIHSLWQNSGLHFSEFMSASQANVFIKENKLDFLMGGVNTAVSQPELTYEQIHKKLLELFANDHLLDDIIQWIQSSVGERAKDKQFIRTLSTAVFEDSIVKSKLKTENLRSHYSLLLRMIDGRIDFELESLYALQALINRLEHPQGILLSIFSTLYDETIFSHESFIKWETSDNPAEQEGKGVALKQLTSFFTQLKEADEETSSTEDA